MTVATALGAAFFLGVVAAAKSNYTRSRNGTKPIPYVSKVTVVTKKHDSRSKSICPIAQQESPGRRSFGVQYEGKLSCMLLGMMRPDVFMYLHTPFNNIDGLYEREWNALEEFSGISNFYNTSTICPYRKSKAILKDDALRNWLHHAVSNRNIGLCNRETAYLLDNCWRIALSEHHTPATNELQMRLREVYFSSPKPPTGFHWKRPNIVVHIGKGNHQQLLPCDHHDQNVVLPHVRDVLSVTYLLV
jgi:hypothetical protein